MVELKGPNDSSERRKESIRNRYESGTWQILHTRPFQAGVLPSRSRVSGSGDRDAYAYDTHNLDLDALVVAMLTLLILIRSLQWVSCWEGGGLAVYMSVR